MGLRQIVKLFTQPSQQRPDAKLIKLRIIYEMLGEVQTPLII